MMTIPLIATSVESHSHSVIDGLPHLTGMAMVMVALAFLWGVCALTARIVHTFIHEGTEGPGTAAPVQQASAATANATATSATSPAGNNSIAPEIVAVIAAAVATVYGNRPVHVVSIKPMNTGWERAGRQAVLTSHRIR